MSIDLLHFSPWSALAGGVLIGLSAGWLIAANGRIAGISGLLASVLQPAGEGWAENALFILGLLLAPLLWGLFAALPPVEFHSDTLGLIGAGLLVGLGTRYGSGCTSGHGVCGISRLAPRSIIATLCFMATGFATVWVTRHLLGLLP